MGWGKGGKGAYYGGYDGYGGGGGGQWMWVPVQTAYSAPKNKGTGKGKGKGKGKSKGRFTDLPLEKQMEIQEKWAERVANEGRTPIGLGTFKGKVVSKCRGYGWIRPLAAATLPKKVRDSMSAMTSELRDTAAVHDSDKNQRFGQDVLYFRMADRSDMSQSIEQDMLVKFKVYTDEKGAGAMEIEAA